MPRYNGWSSGNTPLPLVVTATGQPRYSASRRTERREVALREPAPARINGFSADDRCSMAMRVWAASSSNEERTLPEIGCVGAGSLDTSSGSDRNTGPRRPLNAVASALRMIDAAEPARVICSEYLQ